MSSQVIESFKFYSRLIGQNLEKMCNLKKGMFVFLKRFENKIFRHNFNKSCVDLCINRKKKDNFCNHTNWCRGYTTFSGPFYVNLDQLKSLCIRFLYYLLYIYADIRYIVDLTNGALWPSGAEPGILVGGVEFFFSKPWCLRATLKPPVGPAQRLGGGPGGEAPGSS